MQIVNIHPIFNNVLLDPQGLKAIYIIYMRLVHLYYFIFLIKYKINVLVAYFERQGGRNT